MFRRTTASFLVSATLSALLSFAGVSASVAQSTQVRVKIPFAFQADQQEYQPGVYTFQLSPTSNRVQVVGSSHTGQFLSLPDETLSPADKGKVVFKRYGSTYFLREIWMAGSKFHVHTLPSRAEKQLQLASNPTLPHTNTGEELALTQTPK